MKRNTAVGLALGALAVGGAAWALTRDDHQSGPDGTGPATPSPADTENPTEADLKAEQEAQWVQAVFDYSSSNAIEQKDSSIARAGADKLRAHKYVFPEVAALAEQAAVDLDGLADQIDAELGEQPSGGPGGEGGGGGYGIMESGDDWSLSE